MTKKIIFLILLLALCKTSYSAELLVKANNHWMDELTQPEVDKMTPEQKQSYEARGQRGDIVSVAPDGWPWGKEECLPRFVVIKIPGMTEAEAKKYEETLSTTSIDKNGMPVSKLIRRRKYSLPKTDIEAIKTNTATMTKATLTSKIITKTGATSEISSPVKEDIVYISKKWKKIVCNWFVRPAYAATQLKKTVMPSGGDYTALETCMNANEQNLVTADKYFDVEIDGTWSSADTTAVTIHNYTTDATRYINIYTTSTARHNGTIASGYKIQTASSTTGIGMQTSGFSRLDGIIVYKTGYSSAIIYTGTNGSATVKNCIVAGNGQISSTRYGIMFSGDGNSGNNHYIYNNIVYNMGNASGSMGMFLYQDGSNVYVYNNTVYGCTVGIARMYAGSPLLKNNICYNNGTDYSGAWNASSTNNLSKDTTAPALNTYYTSKTLTFVNTTGGSEDFHLVSSDTDAIDLGADLSGTFTDDIDGVTRSGTWDIGADEYVAAVTGYGQVI